MFSLKKFNLNQLSKKLTGDVFSQKNNIILHNVYVLYIIFFLSLANLYYLAISNDFLSVTIFILIGFLTSFFSKNMLIILFIALTVTNILKHGTNIRNEGFENEDEKKEDEEEDEEKEEEETFMNEEEKEKSEMESIKEKLETLISDINLS
jgi:hypothetical protein